MQQPETIEHKGIIERIGDGKIQIRMIRMPACSSCNINGKCPLPGAEERPFTMVSDDTGDYKVGDEVSVQLKTSSGHLAVLVAYFIPFVIMITTLCCMIAITGNEPASGICALLTVPLYYGILYLIRKKITKKFTFIIGKSPAP